MHQVDVASVAQASVFTPLLAPEGLLGCWSNLLAQHYGETNPSLQLGSIWNWVSLKWYFGLADTDFMHWALVLQLALLKSLVL